MPSPSLSSSPSPSILSSYLQSAPGGELCAGPQIISNCRRPLNCSKCMRVSSGACGVDSNLLNMLNTSPPAEWSRGRNGRIHKFNLGWNSILRRATPHRCFLCAICISPRLPSSISAAKEVPRAHKNFNCQKGSKQLMHV
jgi:hypothetical protein